MDYPHRVVDHDVAHKENIKKMAEAYRAGKTAAGDEGGAAEEGDDEDKSEEAKPIKRKKTSI